MPKSVLPVLCLCTPCPVPTEAGRSLIPGLELQTAVNHHTGWLEPLELNTGSLEEQPVLLAAEPSRQTIRILIVEGLVVGWPWYRKCPSIGGEPLFSPPHRDCFKSVLQPYTLQFRQLISSTLSLCQSTHQISRYQRYSLSQIRKRIACRCSSVRLVLAQCVNRPAFCPQHGKRYI